MTANLKEVLAKAVALREKADGPVTAAPVNKKDAFLSTQVRPFMESWILPLTKNSKQLGVAVDCNERYGSPGEFDAIITFGSADAVNSMDNRLSRFSWGANAFQLQGEHVPQLDLLAIQLSSDAPGSVTVRDFRDGKPDENIDSAVPVKLTNVDAELGDLFAGLLAQVLKQQELKQIQSFFGAPKI